MNLTIFLSERPKLYAILAFLSLKLNWVCVCVGGGGGGGEVTLIATCMKCSKYFFSFSFCQTTILFLTSILEILPVWLTMHPAGMSK